MTPEIWSVSIRLTVSKYEVGFLREIELVET